MDGVDKYSRMTLVLIYGPEGFRNRSITKLWSSTVPSRRHTREGRSAHHPHHHFGLSPTAQATLSDATNPSESVYRKNNE